MNCAVTNKVVLCFGGSRAYYESLKEVRDLGYILYLVDRNPNCFSKHLADRFFCVDFSNVDEVFHQVLSCCEPYSFLPFNDVGVLTLGKLRSKYGVKTNFTEDVALKASHKKEMRNCWALDSRMNQIRSYEVASLEAGKEKFKALGGKAILKPAHGILGGSRGVIVVDTEEDLEKGFSYCMNFCTDQNVLVESFLSSEAEYTVDGIVIEGRLKILSVGENKKGDLPFRVNRRIVYDDPLNMVEMGKIYDEISFAIKQVGLINSVVHVELGVENGKFFIFELGARMGGGNIPQITKEVCGVSEVGAAIKIGALDVEELIELPDILKTLKYAVYEFLFLPKGVLESVHGLDDLREKPWVIDADVTVPLGSRLSDVENGLNRQGFLTLSYPKFDKYSEWIDHAYALLKIRVRR